MDGRSTGGKENPVSTLNRPAAPADAKQASTAPRRAAQVDLEAEADFDRCGALKDFWYVACASNELAERRPVGRKLFGVPIVVFRGPEGTPAALYDRCLHRNARLSA